MSNYFLAIMPAVAVAIGFTDTVAGWALRATISLPLYWSGLIDPATLERFVLF